MTILELRNKSHAALKSILLRTIRAKPNGSIAKENALEECMDFLKTIGTLEGRLSGAPRDQMRKHVNEALGALKRSGKVEYYSTGVRDRVRLPK